MLLDAAGLQYVRSDVPTFTRPGVGSAWIGERIVNGPARCGVTDQAPLACRIIANGVPVTAEFR